MRELWRSRAAARERAGSRDMGGGMRRPKARRAAALLPVLLCLLQALLQGNAQAQEAEWTVQTVAFRDFREANVALAHLTGLGLDAYTEFSMNRGLQYSRVRFGCFDDRAAADAFATAMRRHATREAAVVPLTPTAPVLRCLHQDVGFIKPDHWSVDHDVSGVPAFDVEVAGHPARIVYDGARWVVLQDGDPMPSVSWAATTAFEQGSMAGAPVVMETVAGRRLVLCLGRLLATVGDVAIADQGDAVVACRFLQPGASLAVRSP